MFEMEITESTIMENISGARQTLKLLRQLGIRVSIDDFGKGYSSLEYLKQFPLDRLKIDRSFIKNIPYNQDDTSISSAIISLAHRLDLKVVAEGVENREQLQFLESVGCDYVQGGYYSMPIPASKAISFLERLPNLF